MKAFARIVAEADGCGGTGLAVLHGESPLLPRRTGGWSGKGVTVHLVGGAAGPLRGDDLRLEVTVGAGAHLTVRSVAAQLALPGRPGLPPSRLEIHATVAGTLHWLPEPLIAAADCDHHTTTFVEVADGGSVLWREDLVCGRHEEPPGDVRLSTTVRYGGTTLYRHDLAVGPNAPAWASPAVLGTGRAIGTLLAVPGPLGGFPASVGAGVNTGASTGTGAGTGASTGTGVATGASVSPDASVGSGASVSTGTGTGVSTGSGSGSGAAIMPLAGSGVLATAVGEDIREVCAALDPLWVDHPAGLSRRPATSAA